MRKFLFLSLSLMAALTADFKQELIAIEDQLAEIASFAKEGTHSGDIERQLEEIIQMADANARFNEIEEQLSSVVAQVDNQQSTESNLSYLQNQIDCLQAQICSILEENAVGDEGVKLSNARPCNGSGFFVTLAYLYWKPFVRGSEYAYKYDLSFDPNFPGTVLIGNGKGEKIDFGMKSGIRVGLGWTLPCNGWDVGLYYTYIRPTQRELLTGSSSPVFGSDNRTIFPLLAYNNVSSAETVETVETHWKLRYQTIDFEFGKGVFLGPMTLLRPHLGVRGAFVDQEMTITYQGNGLDLSDASPYEIDGKNDFHGAGLRAGLGSTWFLPYGLHAFGDFAASLFWGNLETSQKHTANQIVVSDIDFDQKQILPATDLELGLGWQIWFNESRNCFRLRLSYEMQYLFDQLQMQRFTAGTQPLYVRTSDAIGFHGLTIEGRMDF